MKALSWMRARPKTLASAAGVAVGAIALTTMAFTYEGFPTTQVDLNDGGVWITKTSSVLVGHFNHESTVLDGGLRTLGEDYDILQQGSTVLVVDDGNSTVSVVDPARVSLGDSARIPSSAKVALGNKTAAILDKKSGNLWVVPVKGLSSFEVQGAEPVAELDANADVAVAQDGTVFGVSSERGEIVTVLVDNQGEATSDSTKSIGELDPGATITAVGTTPVVLSGNAVLTTDGLRSELKNPDGAVLQLASAARDSVTVATMSELVDIPLDGAEPSLISAGAQGTPAAPVSLRGCSYGAWGGSAKFVRECGGTSNDKTLDIPDAAGVSAVTFRVNRDVIILNDAVGGAAWLATDSMQRVDNWNDLTPPEGESEDEEDSSEETVETTLPERSEENTEPVAEDDSFGVRPGATALLPIIDNDNDPDGDVLIATVVGDMPSIGEVQLIQNGAAMQIAVGDDASGSASFVYEINDGRGGKDKAKVSLKVHEWDQNSAPTPKRKTTLAVESGGSVSYNVLPDWIDPDGDDIYLSEVIAADGDTVEFTTDGQITYHALGSLQGRKDIQISVSDGFNEIAAGTIALDVRPAGSTDPKTNADHALTRANEQVVIAPLANDTSSGREPLRLARVDEVPGATILADFPNKTFTFSAPTVGVYYVQYLVSAGPNAVPGLVRIDVLEAADTDLPPVAVRDVALLPTGGDVLVGVLNNDSDPGGGLLVVQSVSVDPGSGISVSVLNHETLRITDQGSLKEQARITYRISNGSATAEGEVVVIPIPAPAQILPPVANDDQAVVRVGDVVTIHVLDNDTHPSNDTIHVAPELVETVADPLDGEAFVSQDTVRFKAGDVAKTVYLTYETVDSRQQKDAGYITIQIRPLDEEANAAPRPRDLTARALSGTAVNIAVPLDGLDADGDSVELIGIASNPSKGIITKTAQNYLTYEALENSTGVDSFTYKVRDRLGKEGTATIRIGIAPAEQVNRAPYAVKDSVVVRPGREVAVPVMLNDSDPEGDLISLVSDGLNVPTVEGLSARVSGDRVLIKVPDRALETSLQYTISDARGATATAVVQIAVSDDVPLLTPIARDDRIQPTDLKLGLLDVVVDVLANDEDPDGTVDALDIAVGAGGILLEDRSIQVTVGESMQLVRYTLTDRDGLETSAFIFVPALESLRPWLATAMPVEVLSGETKVIPLADYVSVAEGGTPILTEHAKVAAMHSNGADLVQDGKNLVYTSAEGYFGQDAISFEVTDGAGPDDPAGRKATLQIPITVLPPANQQPSFDRGEMSVAPGEAAISLDLAALTTDPDAADAGKHTYTVVGGTGDGVSATIVDRATLLVEASTSAKKGTIKTLQLRISDGETDPIEGTVSVIVTASTRAMPAANTDTRAEVDQGKRITIPVLENDFNPFPETPLKVMSAVIETGIGSATIQGDKVDVTPGADFVGTMVVRYRIQDATEDVDREVEGQIVLTVQGVPEAPGAPTITSVQDRTVVVSYTPPSNNGAEITHYTVKAVQGGAFTKQCESTTCTLSGLTNNVEYVFQVTATNRVGDSSPSGVSEVARPDARPDTPIPPKLVFGDRSLNVTWTTPTTPGSPVERFTLEISPAPPSGITQKEVTGNAIVWEGLENGADYQVRVQAHNRAPEASSWSGWSASEIPAGPPAKPNAPTTAELAPVGNQAQMQVNWAAPNNNGDALAGYQLEVRQGSSVVRTISPAAGATSQAVTVPTSETGYTYRIRAVNKAGWGEWSDVSPERRGVVAPSAPITVVASEGNNAVSVTFTPGSRNGARANEVTYQYRVNSGGWRSDWDGQNIGNGQVNNNGSYTIGVRAVATVDGVTYAGAASAASNSVAPYGPIGQPAAGGSVAGTKINWTWSAPARNGRDVTMQVRFDGGSWQNVALTSTGTTGSYGYSQTVTMDVRVTDAAGQTKTSSVSRTTVAKPPPPPSARAWAVRGPNSGQCSPDVCYLLYLSVSNFPAGNYSVYCLENGQRFSGPFNFNIPANGPATSGIYCYHGGFNSTYALALEISGWGVSESIRWD